MSYIPDRHPTTPEKIERGGIPLPFRSRSGRALGGGFLRGQFVFKGSAGFRGDRLADHLEAHPETVAQCAARIRVLDVNRQAFAVTSQRAGEVHLVLLDVNMPGKGGPSCLEALRADYPNVPVLLASGYSAKGSVADTLSAGAARRFSLICPFEPPLKA